MLRRQTLIVFAWFALLLFLVAKSDRDAFAQGDGAKSNVVVILDSSRSMWGQIDGVNKVVSARNAISAIAREQEGKARLGLVSFGHRQSSGCGDVETLLDPVARDAKDFSKVVHSIKPKGSTLIAEALFAGARAAHHKDQATSLILIADGLDNCNADPRQTAGDLRQNAKDLRIHAVSFDAKAKENLVALKHIAEETGCTFTAAENEAELANGVKTALKAVMTPRMPKIASAQAEPLQAMPRSDPVTTESIRQAQTAPAATPGSPEQPFPPTQAASQADRSAPPAATVSLGTVPVTLAARTVDGGAIIKSGLVWWIYKNAKTKDGKYQLVETYREGTPSTSLPPGSYRIVAAYGKVNLIKDIEVKQGQEVHETFVLNAGGLRLNAVTLSGTMIPPNSVHYDLFADESESDQFGNRKLVLRNAKPGVVLRLNAGAYQIVSKYGDANAIVRADVTVEPGKLTDATINHSASKVTFKLVAQPGGEALADTQWNILTPGGDVVKESAGALPTHILAAGSYRVVAKHQGKNYIRDFVVELGEAKQIEVVIQ